MAWGAIAGAVIGGMMSSGASGDAADAQVAASNAANASNERIFNKQVELQKPFRDTGLSANNRLAYLLGLNVPSSVGSLTEEEIRKSLLPQFTTNNTQTIWQPTPNFDPEDPLSKPSMQMEIGSSTIDEAGLSAEIARRIQAQQSQSGTTDGEFGALLKKFSMDDFQADPGYAFRMSEGLKGVENSAAARGGLLSGGALKAIQKYGQDLASQEYGNAYSRYNADQTNTYNKLAGLINTGQGATNQLTNAAATYGSNVSNNIIGAGNAQAAGAVGQANAWNNAIGQGANLYQQNQLMNLIRNPSSSSGSGWGTGSSYGNQDYGSYF